MSGAKGPGGDNARRDVPEGDPGVMGDEGPGAARCGGAEVTGLA